MTIETGYTRLVHRVKSVQPDGFAVLTGTAGLRRRVPGKVEYEQAEEFVPYTAAEMIAQYKKALADTDYAVIKIAEGAAEPIFNCEFVRVNILNGFICRFCRSIANIKTSKFTG